MSLRHGTREQALRAIRPLAGGTPKRPLLALPESGSRPAGLPLTGFTGLSLPEDGTIPGQATPTNPEAPPRKAHNQRLMFERAFAEQRLSLDDLSPYRVRTAWRAIRWIAIKLGLLHEELLLCMVPEEARDPLNGIDLWYRPYEPEQLTPPMPDRATRRLMEVVRKAAETAEKQPYERLHPTENRIEIHEKAGFSLIPTHQNGRFWVQALEIAAEHLFLGRGSPKEPEQGRYGLLGLTEPAYADIACPGLPEMLFWELFLIDEATKLYATTGEHRIDALFREYYGLLPIETRAIFAHARRCIRDRTDLDVAEQRALMVVRVEEVLHRAQMALDPRAELMALKLLSQTVGITRAEPEDLKALFKRVVNEASETRELDYGDEQAEDERPDGKALLGPGGSSSGDVDVVGFLKKETQDA